MASQQRFTKLPYLRQLVVAIILFLCIAGVEAQSTNSGLVELVTATFDDDMIVHLRVPRGQTVEVATVSQGDLTITLESDVIALEQTQFILLDASDEMLNLQPVVQSNIPRLWQRGEQETSLIFFDSEADVLLPTDRIEDIGNFLGDYNINPGAPACLAEALTAVNDLTRNYDRSWRILLVTTGDFSRSANCDLQALETAPAPIDVIAITSEIDPDLQDLIDRSGGQFYTANLRSIEARTNEIVTQWGQPTYVLRGNIPEGWNPDDLFELEIELSNGTEEQYTLSFRDYNVPLPATPTPVPTMTAEPTIEEIVGATAEEVVATVVEQVTAVPTIVSAQTTDPANNTANNGVAILLIIGAILFVIGAVVLALTLSRVRRTPPEPVPQQNNDQNFYETLSAVSPENPDSQSSTRIREKSIISSSGDPQTQVASSLDDTFLQEDNTNVIEEHDNLLVTQVLTDDRFRNMMEQSQNNDEIIGWLRLVIESQDKHQDYELTRRGLVIGRSQECDIQITGDGAISRKHARLDVRSNNQVTVSRLSAVNPVVVAGVQIGNRHPLQANDVIHLSDQTRLIFIARQDELDEIDDTQLE